MRYFFAGFTAVLSKASTFDVPGGCSGSLERVAEPLPPPQPCAAKTATRTSTPRASRAGDRADRRFLFTSPHLRREVDAVFLRDPMVNEIPPLDRSLSELHDANSSA